ncbi:MAG: hypothetical protein HY840_12480 [Bacteroidetes bacterium]|nr:hypothetical protein [Bacteroidota bacterium]
MKKTNILSVIAVVFIMSACNNASTNNEQKSELQQSSIDTTKLKPGEIYYQCEMNPEVISDKSDSCPKCGMNLEKKEKK